MNKMTYTTLIVLALAVLLFYAFTKAKLIGFNPLDYKYLFRKGIYSSNQKTKPGSKTFEMACVMKGRAYKPFYLFLKESNQYLTYSWIEPNQVHRMDDYAPKRIGNVHRYVLLDKKGQEIRRLDIQLNFSVRSGLFFAPTYYINWLENGDTTHIEYESIYNKDLKMDDVEFGNKFRELHAKADYFEYINLRAHFDDTIGSAVVFKLDQKWQILLSGVSDSHLYQTTEENEKTAFDTYIYKVRFNYKDPDYRVENKYPPSPPLLQSVFLETNNPNPFEFKRHSNVDDLKLVKYVKEWSTGWIGVAKLKGIPLYVPGVGYGLAFMKLNVGKEQFYFKIPDVEKGNFSSVYNLGVRVFKLPEKYRHDSSLVFVESTQNSGDYRHGGGLYVVRPCETPTANYSDLPKGISEKRYNQLPLTLQEALLDIDNTTELLIESGNQLEWFPEIELLKNLNYLRIRTGLKEVPDGIAKLKNLKILLLDYNQIDSISPKIKELKQLKELNLFSNNLSDFPKVLCELGQLQSLDIGGNKITEIPACISKLHELRYLHILLLNINKLPESMIEMKDLRIDRAEELKQKLPENYHFLFENTF